jgi:hypothetical protein
MNTRRLAMPFLITAVALGGCVYRERTTTVPAASPPTSVVVAPTAAERVVTYPEGRYELRGDGTAPSPYYWVWIPAGAAPPNPPPLPRRPQTQ